MERVRHVTIQSEARFGREIASYEQRGGYLT